MARIRSSSIAALLVTALGLGAPSATRADFTYAEALAALRREHPLIRAADEGADAAEGSLAGAGLWTNPILDASYTYAPVASTYDAAGYYQWGITLFLELADVPEARERSARRTLAAARADARAIVLGLALDLESAMTVAAAERRREINERTAEQIRAARELVIQHVAASEAPAYDTLRIELALATVVASLDASRADVARARAELATVLGPALDSLEGAAVLDLEQAPEIPALEALVTAVRAQRPDVLAAHERAAAASADVEVASRSVFPGVATRIGGGYGTAPGQVDLQIGFAVPFPVIDFGQGSVRAAEASARSIEALAEALAQIAARRVRGLRAEVMLRRQAAARFEGTGVHASDDMLDQAHEGYDARELNVLDLTDAIQSGTRRTSCGSTCSRRPVSPRSSWRAPRGPRFARLRSATKRAVPADGDGHRDARSRRP